MSEESLTVEQTKLLLDLLLGYRINLEGNIAAIEEDPALQMVAAEGIEVSRAELELAVSTIEALQ